MPKCASSASRHSDASRSNSRREGDHALVLDEAGDNVALYDLSVDRAMAHDLSGSDPERVEALSARARPFPRSAPAEATSVPVDEATLEALRALGYVGD